MSRLRALRLLPLLLAAVVAGGAAGAVEARPVATAPNDAAMEKLERLEPDGNHTARTAHARHRTATPATVPPRVANHRRLGGPAPTPIGVAQALTQPRAAEMERIWNAAVATNENQW